MKKKILLIFSLILVLTGCGDNQAYIKNKVLNEFKENNIYSYFNAEGLKKIQEAGFSEYEQIVAINEIRIYLTLNFAKNEYKISLSSRQEIVNVIRDNNIVGCKVDKDYASKEDYAICEVNVSIDGNSITIPYIGNEQIDAYFNKYPILINTLSINESYIKSFSAPKEKSSRGNPLAGKEHSFNYYGIEYNDIPSGDANRNILSTLNLNVDQITSLELDYTNYHNEGELFEVCYGPPSQDYSTTPSGVVIKLLKGERIL